MSENAHSEGHVHSAKPYIRIYCILLVLLVISIVGPMMGGLTVMLVTAFGVAVVKALMVAAYFMHLNVEKKYIWYLLAMAALFLAVLFFGVAPDVMNKNGANWKRLDHSTPPSSTAPAHH